MKVDLHVHSTASDGQYRPTQVIELAANVGLSGIALTDHDTIDGLEEGLQAANKRGLIFVPGIEFSSDWSGTDVHVLGYYINCYHQPLVQKLNELRISRLRRAQKMVKKLRQLGLQVSWNDVRTLAGKATVGRPHVAQVLLEAGYVKTVKEAFDWWIGFNKPAYVPRQKITPFEAVKLIVSAGGVPVIAHPGLIGNESIIFKLVKSGLAGLEAVYPEHTPQQKEHFILLAERLNLVVTGGSDFHGERINDNVTLGKCTVCQNVLEELQRARGMSYN